jgi:HEAT repeat protein
VLKRSAVAGLAWLLLGAASPVQAQVDYLGRPMAEWESDLHEAVPEVRRRAALALAHFGALAVPALVEALDDQDFTVRAAASRALGEIGPAASDALPALVNALDDEAQGVREAAERALEQVRGD